MHEIWTPPVMQVPEERKWEGGSYFDDEMLTKEAVAIAYRKQVEDLLIHLNSRPDHVVYVGSVEDRTNIRAVFNWWVRQGGLARHPNIRIDYGVAEAKTTYGIIGVKVWIFKGEVLDKSDQVVE